MSELEAYLVGFEITGIQHRWFSAKVLNDSAMMVTDSGSCLVDSSGTVT